MENQMRTARASAMLLLATLTLGGCSGDGTGPGTQGQISLSLASRARSAPTGRLASFDITSPTPGTFTDGTNTLVLTKAELVLRKIRLKRDEASEESCAPPLNVQASVAGPHGSDGQGEAESEGHDGHPDACEEMKAGPLLFDVPLATAGAMHTVSVSLDAGTYDEVQFQIHKPEGSADQAFLDANPDFAGVSIRVEGTWNGTPFTFTSGLEQELELPLSPPLVLAENGAADVTIFVDVTNWFADGAGGLLDPSSANDGQPNQSLVRENIQRSFRAFEDANEDGKDDHGTDS
jgi:hypothetical protein